MKDLIVHSEGLVFAFKDSKFEILESGILKVHSLVETCGSKEVVVTAAFKSWQSARTSDIADVDVIRISDHP